MVLTTVAHLFKWELALASLQLILQQLRTPHYLTTHCIVCCNNARLDRCY
jgi:hypothetical protein